jgi:RNA polymerase sigma-70 factor (ECF subfamily)
LNDRNAADDVAQEALRATVEALRAGTVANVAALPGFVYETARHLCARRIRSATRERRALATVAADSSERDAAPDALSRLVSAERQTAVRRALAALDPPDRELLEALYREELPAADLAARLGIDPGALRVRKHRALKRLAARFAAGNAGVAGGTSS